METQQIPPDVRVQFDPLPPILTAEERVAERTTLTLMRTQMRAISEGLPPHYDRMRIELKNFCALLSNHIRAIDGPAG
jgi:hypothetical protein